MYLHLLKSHNPLVNRSCDPTYIGAYNDGLSCLLYADDVVLMSESATGLQRCLNNLSTYCKKWNLTVNIDKSKIIIFNKSGKVLKKDTFLLNDNIIELANEYKYLGIIFKPLRIKGYVSISRESNVEVMPNYLVN